MSYYELPRKTFVSAAAVDVFTLVSLDESGVSPCTEDKLPIGVAETGASAAGQVVGVRLINAGGTIEVKCSGSVAVGDQLSPAADGTVAKSTKLPVCGIALTAGQDELVEMLPLLTVNTASEAV